MARLRSPRLRASRRILLILLLLLVLLMFLVVPSVSWADELGDAARRLAQRIAAALGPRQIIALTVHNSSLLPSAAVAALRRTLGAELAGQGLRISAEPPHDAEIRITLAENIRGLVWVAEIQRGESSTVAIITAPRPVAAQQAVETLTIRKQSLWEQEKPILDVWVTPALDPGPKTMIVLDPENAAVYRAQGEEWRLEHSFALKRTGIRVRDQRGIVTARTDGFDVALDGDNCAVEIQPTPSVKCQEVRHEWLPRQDEIAEVEGKKSPPAHTSAVLEVDGRRVKLIAGVDDRIRLYEDGAEPVATFTGWGSDLASVRSGCGRGWQLLVTGAGDWSEPDTVQALEIVDRQPVVVSAPVSFPGPVLMLRSTPDFHAAIAVVRNLKTGRYEAYSVRISCNQ